MKEVMSSQVTLLYYLYLIRPNAMNKLNNPAIMRYPVDVGESMGITKVAVGVGEYQVPVDV
jgi:hypothetical protein